MNINKAFCLLVGLVTCSALMLIRKEAVYRKQEHSVQNSTTILDRQVLSMGKCVSISPPLQEQLLQATTRDDAHCIEFQLWSRSFNQNDILEPSIHGFVGAHMLFDEVDSASAIWVLLVVSSPAMTSMLSTRQM